MTKEEAINKAIDSLPSNLDEAAEEIMPISYGALEVDIYGGSEPVYSREQMVEMFKAGAEWMAGQYKTLGETEVYLEDDGGEEPYVQEWLDLATTEFAIPGGFGPGDKVIVQIRKK